MSTLLTIVAVIIVFIILFKVFKLLLRLLIVAVFLLLAYLTNPGLEQHRQAVLRKAEKNNHPLTDQTIVIDDYLVFSLTRIEDENRSKVIGAGAFTQVVVFGKLD